MEDFPTLQGPRNSTIGFEVISPSVGQGGKRAVKSSTGLSTNQRASRTHPKLYRKNALNLFSSEKLIQTPEMVALCAT